MFAVFDKWLSLFDGRTVPFAINYFSGRPFYASFDITNHCNLMCDGCDYPILLKRRALGADLPLEGLEARIEAMHKAFGNLLVVLAGFEPTVRKDLPEIIAAASRHNYVGIVTNGTLVTDERAREYWASGLVFASVSMPAFSDARFKGITRVERYCVADIKGAVEALVKTAPKYGVVTIAVTIDNGTKPDEMREIAAYAHGTGAKISFQPYSASKPASASGAYDATNDGRVITVRTLEGVFGGSIADTIMEIKREYPVVVGRDTALRNFDLFVRTGKIPFEPRALKIYANGDVALYPEGKVFSSIDLPPDMVLSAYRRHVEDLRAGGSLLAENCYRCVNLTNRAPFVEQLASIRI